MSDIRPLSDDTLVVVVSDTHIGGDPGHDIFESPGELRTLLDELTGHDGPVDLVLAGDLFDFLRIGRVPAGQDKASTTIARPEYRDLFGALRRFAATDGRRVAYLPGNHDAASWWDHDVQATLRQEGLVDELVLSYAARFASAPDCVLYCEHGHQFDPTNAKTDLDDPLDTPLGDHVVAALRTQIEPAGRVTSDLDLRDLARVFPLASIPEWITSQLFYGLLSRVLTYLLLPLLLGYSAYRIVASLLQPGVQNVVGEIAWDAVLLATAVVLFVLVLQRTAARTMAPLRSGVIRDGEAAASVRQIQELLVSDRPPPLRRDLAGHRIGVFVSGHTHVPALSRRERDGLRPAVIVNSGCWLRQLHPVAARFGAPPVFVGTFVQTHVRIRLRDGRVQVELWQRPRSAQHRLRAIERLAILGRRPAQPPATAPPELIASETL